MTLGVQWSSHLGLSWDYPVLGRFMYASLCRSSYYSKSISQPQKYIRPSSWLWRFSYHAKMSGCTLRFARNSPLRTTLVDESTGHAKYKIETPMRIARSVTRIWKLESSTQPPLNWSEGRLQETSDEIARIYWKLFSPNRIIHRGRVTSRDELLPKCGKLKG